LTIKVATRDDSDPADPEETFASIQQEANYLVLNKLLMEYLPQYLSRAPALVKNSRTRRLG
jgi:hypothetical protein